MSFDWAQYLDLARQLTGLSHAGPVTEEARLRAATSRAYYAAFKRTTNTIQARDAYRYRQTSGRGLHADLIYYLRQHGESTRFDIGFKLEIMRRMRVEADYRDWIAPRLLRPNAESCCQLAADVLTLLSSL